MFACGPCSEEDSDEAPHMVAVRHDQTPLHHSWRPPPLPEDGASELLTWLDTVFASEHAALRARHELVYKTLSLHLVKTSGKAEAEGPGRAEQIEPTALREEQSAADALKEASKEQSAADAPKEASKEQSAADAPKEASKEQSAADALKEASEVQSAAERLREAPEAKEKAKSKTTMRLGRSHQDVSWEHWQEKPWYHPGRIVRSPMFEVVFSFLIVMNTITIAAESHINGLKAGVQIKFQDWSQTDLIQGADGPFYVLDWMFGSVFTIEVVLKLIALGKEFAYSMWNWVDLFLVVIWLLDASLELPMNSSVLRLGRLARLLRVIRLVRRINGFDSLVVMTTALKGSMQALMWVAILLLIVQTMFSLLINQLLMFYIQNEAFPEASRWKLFELFGTFPRAMLSMFELTLGNWVPIARVLFEELHPTCVIFSIAHKLTFGFACIGVINGVFMQETFKSTANDDVIMVRSIENKKKLHAKKMAEFFRHADSEGDGRISREEFCAILEVDEVKHWFAAQELSVADADHLFDLLDDGDHHLTAKELAFGIGRLKGAAKSLDLARLMREQSLLKEQLIEQSRQLCTQQSAMRQLQAGAPSVQGLQMGDVRTEYNDSATYCAGLLTSPSNGESEHESVQVESC